MLVGDEAQGCRHRRAGGTASPGGVGSAEPPGIFTQQHVLNKGMEPSSNPRDLFWALRDSLADWRPKALVGHMWHRLLVHSWE